MNISQSENKLIIVSEETAMYRYIHIVQDVTIVNTTIVNDEFTDSMSYYTFSDDGYFIVTEMKLTTNPGDYYYISNDTIYDPTGTEITVEELLEVDIDLNPEIVREDQDYISMYYLDDYYLTLLKSKYLKNICNCGCSCIDNIDKVQLDTLTMGLDLIDALLLKLQYHEVQRIVEKLSVCFGLTNTNCNCN